MKNAHVLFTTEIVWKMKLIIGSSDIEIGAGLSGTGDMAFTATNLTTQSH